MDVGVAGLAVMGQNLALNARDKGYKVSVYNRTGPKTRAFCERHPEPNMEGFETLESFVSSLKTPRVVLLMVKSGPPVDEFIAKIGPLLAKEDVLVDGGNSHFRDTERRCAEIGGRFNYIGCGISGGEEGARNGPSMMPGGDKEGWAAVEPILMSMAAKTDFGGKERPCCSWIGAGGSGHFVKMVHNGIEYADMQIIADTYQILRHGETSEGDIAELFGAWAAAPETAGFLLEISEKVSRRRESDGTHTLDLIVDRAEQKGTGRWTAQEALEMGVPSTLITEAVFSRGISNAKERREEFALRMREKTPFNAEEAEGSPPPSKEVLQGSLSLAKAIAYLQGFEIIEKASEKHSWALDLEELCRIWSGGCIIRSTFLCTMAKILSEKKRSGCSGFESTSVFARLAKDTVAALRETVKHCVVHGIYAPCLASALTYFDGLCTSRGSGNFIQALRDYFGAHMVQVKGSAGYVHINWS